MGCLSGIVKYLLFLFNLIIVLCAIALIAVGAIILVNEGKGIESFNSFSVGGFAIAVGVIIFLIAFFGCYGAVKENSCLLTTYAIILIVLMILQIVLGALAFVSIKNDDDSFHNAVKKVVDKVFDDFVNDKENKDKRKIITDIQHDFVCCGTVGSIYWSDNNMMEMIASCPMEGLLTGCIDKFEEVMSSNIKIIGGIAIGFGVLELVGAIFAFVVRNR